MTPEQVVIAIDGYQGVLVAGGVRLPVAITARVVRDERETAPTPDGWRQYETGPAIIECRLSGVPKVGPEIADRRQRACEAFSDSVADVGYYDADTIDLVHACVETAIETATRVRITPESLRAMLREVDLVGMNNGGLQAGVTALLTELGFEVEG